MISIQYNPNFIIAPISSTHSDEKKSKINRSKKKFISTEQWGPLIIRGNKIIANSSYIYYLIDMDASNILSWSKIQKNFKVRDWIFRIKRC